MSDLNDRVSKNCPRCQMPLAADVDEMCPEIERLRAALDDAIEAMESCGEHSIVLAGLAKSKRA